jgi:Tfp pilus assembly protein PilF
MLGYKYMADGQMDKAKTHFEIYMRVYPTTPNAYDYMGDYYVEAGDKTKAQEMYMKAYELDKSWEKSKKKADKL